MKAFQHYLANLFSKALLFLFRDYYSPFRYYKIQP